MELRIIISVEHNQLYHRNILYQGDERSKCVGSKRRYKKCHYQSVAVQILKNCFLCAPSPIFSTPSDVIFFMHLLVYLLIPVGYSRKYSDESAGENFFNDLTTGTLKRFLWGLEQLFHIVVTLTIFQFVVLLQQFLKQHNWYAESSGLSTWFD